MYLNFLTKQGTGLSEAEAAQIVREAEGEGQGRVPLSFISGRKLIDEVELRAADLGKFPGNTEKKFTPVCRWMPPSLVPVD